MARIPTSSPSAAPTAATKDRHDTHRLHADRAAHRKTGTRPGARRANQHGHRLQVMVRHADCPQGTVITRAHVLLQDDHH